MYRILVQICLAIVLVFALHFDVKATHYLGGELTYSYLGNSNYKITFRIYQDCKNGDPNAISQDLPLLFSVFSADGVLVGQDSISGSTNKLITVPQSGCYSDANTYCVNYVEGSKTIHLPLNNVGYNIVNQRCCLAGNVLNITDPGSNGLTLYCYIPGNDQLIGSSSNNSPVFNSLPPVRGCINSNLVLDFSATDADGDSLIYSLAPAYKGGSANNAKPITNSLSFPAIPYLYPYTAQQPFGNYGNLSLDPTTGIAKGYATAFGYYLINVVCQEYRNKKLIGTISRPFVLQIANCHRLVNASIVKDSVAIKSGLNVSIIKCGGDKTISFKNNSEGATAYHWDFGVPGVDDDTSNIKDPQFTYPASGKYTLTLIAYGPNCNDTLETQVWLSDDVVKADFDISNGPCILDTFLLTDHSLINGNLASANDSVNFLWTVHSDLLHGITATFFTNKAGMNTAREVVISKNGCLDVAEKEFEVKQAAINAGNDTTVVQNSLLTLFATGGVSYTWIDNGFVLGTSLNNPDLSVATGLIYRNLGFVVIGKDANDCRGIDTVFVTVTQYGYAFMPSAFSPNGDGKNDFLKPKISGYNFRSFSVFNRIGNRVFFSESLQNGWDGTYKNQQVSGGVYYWMIRAKNQSGGDEVFSGDVTLVR